MNTAQNPTYRTVLWLSIPIILANLTQPLMSAVDTAVAGHLPGAHYLAGVALGALLFNFVFWGFGFLRMGTTGVVAQYFGSQESTAVVLTIGRAMLIAWGIGVLLWILQIPIIEGGLALLGASADATEQARLYAYGRIWAAPFALTNYVIAGWLLGVQRVRVALAIQILINIVNLVTVLTFVYGFDWGVQGIGRATAIADISGTLVGLTLIWRWYQAELKKIAWRVLLESKALQRLFQINSHLFVRTACLQATMAWFVHMGAQQGDALLAANAVLLNFLAFTAYGLDGFAHAAETLSGEAVGRQNQARLSRVIRVTLVWGLVGSALYALTYGVAGMQLIGLLTDQIDIATLASQYLIWLVLATFVSMPAYMYDGVYMGATRTQPLMWIMLACALIFFGLSWVLVPLWGNHGLWLAFLTFNGLRGVGLRVLLKPVIYKSMGQSNSY